MSKFKCWVNHNGVLYPPGSDVPVDDTPVQTQDNEKIPVVAKPKRKKKSE